jgi:hypothetical protein
MTKEEMLKKISELSSEQKDFLRKEIRKHSSKIKEKTPAKENDQKQSSK